jgi:hypothetical protein
MEQRVYWFRTVVLVPHLGAGLEPEAGIRTGDLRFTNSDFPSRTEAFQSVNRRPNDVIRRQSTPAELRDPAGAAMMLAPLVASSVIRKALRPILATASDPQAEHLPWVSNSISARQLTQHHCFFIVPPNYRPPNLRAPKNYAPGLPLKRAERGPNSLASNHDLSIHDLHRAPEQAAGPAAVQAAPYLRGLFGWVSLGFDNDTLAVLELRHPLAEARPFRSASGTFRSAPG